MYKKLALIAFLSGSIFSINNQDTSTVLEHCQTIVDMLQEGNVGELQQLLEENPDMHEALLISLVASQRQ